MFPEPERVHACFIHFDGKVEQLMRARLPGQNRRQQLQFSLSDSSNVCHFVQALNTRLYIAVIFRHAISAGSGRYCGRAGKQKPCSVCGVGFDFTG